MTLPLLRHFAATEFRHPDAMNWEFVTWLDAVRAAANVPFRLTSDARTTAENASVGGSERSLHLLGRAVDFTIDPWNRDTLWRVVEAVVRLRGDKSVELELVQGPTDRHIHLGLFEDQRPSRLVLAIE